MRSTQLIKKGAIFVSRFRVNLAIGMSNSGNCWEPHTELTHVLVCYFLEAVRTEVGGNTWSQLHCRAEDPTNLEVRTAELLLVSLAEQQIWRQALLRRLSDSYCLYVHCSGVGIWQNKLWENDLQTRLLKVKREELKWASVLAVQSTDFKMPTGATLSETILLQIGTWRYI